MGAKYLIRFDDICPTMNWEVWERVEKILIENKIKPILALVPDNCDPILDLSLPNKNYHIKVKEWYKNGWTLAQHGFKHLKNSNKSGIMGLNSMSEFAGLPFDEQDILIKKGKIILESYGIKPNMWISPFHSFDKTTLLALKKNNFKYISDGFFWGPRNLKNGLVVIPQQLWDFKKMGNALCTICFHINNWDSKKIETFEKNIKKFKNAIISLEDVEFLYSKKKVNLFDVMIFVSFRLFKQLKKILKYMLK